MYNEFKDIILAAIEQLLDKEKTRGFKKKFYPNMLASTFYYRNGKIHMTTTTFTVNITLNKLFNVLTSHSLTERQRGQRKECNEQHSLWCLVLLHEVDASTTSIYLHR